MDGLPTAEDLFSSQPVALLHFAQVCTQVVIELAPRISQCCVSPGATAEEQVIAVAIDVVDRWRRYRPELELFGPGGCVAQYVAAVEYRREAPAEPNWDVRAWSAHAGYLLRVIPPTLARPDDHILTVLDQRRHRSDWAGYELEYDVAVEQLRTAVAAELSPLIAAALEHNRGRISTVMDAVMAAWLKRGLDEPARLTGRGGFTDHYFQRVNYADREETYRPEFLTPTHDDSVDVPACERRVWSHHVDQLRVAASGQPGKNNGHQPSLPDGPGVTFPGKRCH